MLEAQQSIQVLVAPVVMISANGLICLAIYNRLAAVIARGRAFHKEWFDLRAQQANHAEEEQPAEGRAHGEHRIAMLNELVHSMIHRARLLRNALVCLLSAVLAMLGCSVALGLATCSAAAGVAALVLFYAGVGVMALGIGLAMAELRSALQPLLLEHDLLERRP